MTQIISAYEEGITDLSHKLVIQQPRVAEFKKIVENVRSVNPYQQTKEAAEALLYFGIHTDPMAHKTHSHPAAKALENAMLRYAGQTIGAKTPLTCIYMKSAKLSVMKRHPKNTHIINVVNTVHDIPRYRDENKVANLSGRVTTSDAFMHDALHYYSPEQIVTLFALNPDMTNLYASVIIPPEILHEHDSLYPSLYTIDYVPGVSFTYKPDGKGGAAYTQSLDCQVWLKTNKIKGPITLSIAKLESYASHHLLLITRKDLPTHKRFCFDSEALVSLPAIYSHKSRNVQEPIRKKIFNRMVAYVNSVSDKKENKKVTTRDIWSKLRQIITEMKLKDYNPKSLALFVDYLMVLSSTTGHNEDPTIIETSILYQMYTKMSGQVKKAVEHFFGPYRHTKHLALLSTTDFSYDITTGIYYYNQSAYAKDLMPFDLPKHGGLHEVPIQITKGPLGCTSYHEIPPQTDALTLAHPFKVCLLTQDHHGLSDLARDLECAGVSRNITPRKWYTIRLDSGPIAIRIENHSYKEKLSEDQAKTLLTELIEKNPTNERFLLSAAEWQICNSNLCNIIRGLEDRRGIDTTFEVIKRRKLHNLIDTAAHLIEQPHRYDGVPLDKDGLPYHRSHCQDDKFTVIENKARDNLCFYQSLIDLGLSSLDCEELKDHLIKQALPDCSKSQKATLLTHLSSTNLCPNIMPQIAADLFATNLCIHYQQGSVASKRIVKSGRGVNKTQHMLLRNLHYEALTKGEVKPSAAALKADPVMTNQPGKGPEPNAETTPAPQAPKPAKPTTPPFNPLDVLENLGFSLTNGNRVTPIEMGRPLDEPTSLGQPDDELMRDMQKLHQGLCRKVYKHIPDKDRASDYISDLKRGIVGTIHHRDHATMNPEKMLRTVQSREPNEVVALVVYGAGGAGKSHAIQEVLRKYNKEFQRFHIIVPTVNLQKDWRDKIRPTNTKIIKTYENALLDSGSPCVIFDDISKLPPGYIDSYLILHPHTELVVLTGDPKQSVYHVAHPESKCTLNPPEIDYFSQYNDYYINATHRNPKNIAEKIGVYSEKPDGPIIVTDRIPDKSTLLVPSIKEVQLYGDAGHSAYTYAGCQGLTLPTVNLVISSSTPLCSERVMYTALSRASLEVRLINTYSNDSGFLDKLHEVPYLSSFLTLIAENEGTDHVPLEADPPPEHTPLTHLPIDSVIPYIGEVLDTLPPKEEREIYAPLQGGHTDTVDETTPLTSAIPRHRGSDQALMEVTMNARLSTSTPERNRRSYNNTTPRDIGNILWLNYKHALNLKGHDIEFNADLWDQCTAEIETKYLSKTKQQITNAIDRLDPERLSYKIDLFLKSQWVQKPEKFAKEKNKPGQTIAAFTQTTVRRTGIAARYMRRMEERLMPEKIMIFCEKNYEDLEKFRKEQWRHGLTPFTNDYTAFDQSQDAATLQFEVQRMKFYNIPDEEVDFYLMIKFHANTFIGTLDIMRLTGEGPTFDANTATNIAFDHTKYLIPPECARLYSGDDSARDNVYPEKPSWKYIEPHIKLKAKPLEEEIPTFCGWKITPHGIIRDPFKLWFSFQRAKDLNQLSEVAVAYRHDILPAYLLGDKLYDILSPAEMEYHRNTCRDLHVEAHLTIVNGIKKLDSELGPTETKIKGPTYKLNSRQRRSRRARVKLPSGCINQ